MTITIADGRGALWQWDTGRRVKITDGNGVKQVHYQNKCFGRSVDVDVGDDGTAIIPDELLQDWHTLTAYAYVTDDAGGYTKVQVDFAVHKRARPSDYVYTPTEHAGFDRLRAEIGDLSALQTSAKDNLVSAINEAAASGGSGGGIFEINVTSYTEPDPRGSFDAVLDKTFAEIEDATKNGKEPVLFFKGVVLSLIQCGGCYAFAAVGDGPPGIVYTCIVIFRDGSVLAGYMKLITSDELADKVSDSLRYTPQTLSDEQKAQARENIGATLTAASIKGALGYTPAAPGDIPVVPTAEISANTAARHSHANKAVIDGITAAKAAAWDAKAGTAAATQSAAGLMSAADKAKLDGIERGANKTTVPTALKNPNALTIQIGGTSITYDGSTAQTVTIADGTEVSY